MGAAAAGYIPVRDRISSIHQKRKAGNDKAEAVARAAVDRLFKAIVASDVEKCMAAVDVPFSNDGRKIVKDRDELRKQFEGVAKRDHSNDKLTIRKVYDLATFKTDAPKIERLRALAEVLGPGDRIVAAEVEAGGRTHEIWMAVRIKNGEGKVAGVCD